jgi:hypothetical protein
MRTIHLCHAGLTRLDGLVGFLNKCGFVVVRIQHQSGNCPKREVAAQWNYS